MIIEARFPRRFKESEIRTILENNNIKILMESGTGEVKLEGTSVDFQTAKTQILALNELQEL